MTVEQGRCLTLSPDGDTWWRNGRPWRSDRPLYAVIGRPVSHSLSPRMQQAALDAAGIPAHYVAVALAPDQWPLLSHRAAALGLRGFNVTAPYKERVPEFCPRLTPAARALGAVNTVRVLGDGTWEGHNTDRDGLAAVVARLWQGKPGRALVCGAGGAARAAVDALAAGGWRVTVAARAGASRQRLVAWLTACSTGPREVVVRDWPAPPGSSPPDLLVAAVPAGVDVGTALPPGAWPAAWLDLRYGAAAPAPPSREGFRWTDGLALLVAQGEIAFQWWHGRSAPPGVMAAAVA